MGLMGLVMLAGPALGPTLTGLILDTLSWNWIFWLTVPFLLFSLIFGIKFLPNVNEVRHNSIDASVYSFKNHWIWWCCLRI